MPLARFQAVAEIIEIKFDLQNKLHDK